MSELLSFFTLEASEYVERLDGVLARAAQGPPALEAFLTDARALRGSATMARQGAIADVAGELERVAKSLQAGAIGWDARVRGAVIAAVDDLKILVRAVRTWSADDDRRALARRDELAQLAPARARVSSSAVSPGGSFVYLGAEASDVAGVLDAFVRTPGDTAPLLAALPRVRALRGMASLHDLPPLAEVVEAIEDAAKPIELGTGAATPDLLALFGAAAAVLRRAAIDLRAGVPDPLSEEARRFLAALDARGSTTEERDHVVPIASLFYADSGPHMVSEAATPPTTPGQRFRMEVVSQAEHLQRLVAEARGGREDTARARAGRALRSALLALRATAHSFGESTVAAFLASTADAAAALDTLALGAISEAATLLANPSTDHARLEDRLHVLAAGRAVDTAIGAGLSPVARGTPASVPRTEPKLAAVLTPPGRSSPAAGADLRTLLASGLAGLTRLDREPFSQPADIPDELASVDEFLYRGRAALERALELRNAIRTRGGEPAAAELDELFALLDLATVE